MSRAILDSEAALAPRLDANGDPETGTGPEKSIGRFVGVSLIHSFGITAWDITVEGSVDGVNFQTIPGGGNLTGTDAISVPDFWRTIRVVSNTVDTLATFDAVLSAREAI